MMAHTFNGRNLLHSKVYTYCIHYTQYSIHYTIHFLPNIIANKKNCIHYNILNGCKLTYIMLLLNIKQIAYVDKFNAKHINYSIFVDNFMYMTKQCNIPYL